MRVLLCQTPRLTYVQAIELLQRETMSGQVDMALFPEMAIEHPPQCTGQGELTFENVAILMLSRFCKQRRMYVVLGSVEERVDGHVYDTCVVLNRDGELQYFYRKQSAALLGKTSGIQPGIFDSEFGPIGILLGAEVEEEQRWQDLLARRPYLILNPARAPMQLDPVLIHTHPELQVSAWHKSLRRLEHIVETRTRQCACSFVRADAPFGDGGAGTSLLVEPHRSVLTPRWGVAFCIVDTLHPYELEGRKLPGWRELSVDERARMATRDRALLTQEEIERGPRYLVWTLRHGSKGGLRMPSLASQWNNSAAARDNVAAIDPNLANMVTGLKASSFLVPLTGKDAVKMYASITSTGQFVLWDVKLKREISSSMLGASGLTAVGAWSNPNQIVVASSSRGITTLKIFEEHSPIGEIKFDSDFKVTKHRKCSTFMQRHQTDHAEAHGHREHRASIAELKATSARAPHVKSLFHVRGSQALLVLSPVDSESGPTAKLVDMEDGQVQDVDVYGNGPHVFKDIDSEDDDPMPDKPQAQAKVDKLLQARIVEQNIKGRLHQILVCLYDSNRLVQCTLHDIELHELMLVEDLAGDRTRSDSPICFAVLPNSNSNESYHLVVSYQSLMIRWWQVSLTTGKMASQVTLNAAVTHLTMFDWPLPAGAGHTNNISLPVEKPPGNPRGHQRGNTRFSVAGQQANTTASRDRQSVRVVTEDPEQAYGQHRASLLPAAGLHGGLSGFIKHRASIKQQRASTIDQRKSLIGGAAVAVDDDYLLNKDHSCLCVIAFDVSGGMPILLARGGRVAKVYTSNDHFVDKSAKVDQLVCDGHAIAVQISTGDVRHIEFVFEEDVISLKDVPMDLPM